MATNIKEIKLLDANGNVINPSSDDKLQTLIDNSVKGLHWDEAWVGIDFAHYETHEGDSYVFSHTINNVSGGTVFNYIFLTNSSQPHIIFDLNYSTDVTFVMYENTTYTGGTEVIPVCKNRVANNTPNSRIIINSSITDVGTQLLSLRKGAVSVKSTVENRSDGEFILKNNTTYLFRVTVNTNGTNGTIIINFYE